MTIPTEPIGSIPRPPELIEAFTRKGPDDPSLDPLYEAAVRDTLTLWHLAVAVAVFAGASAGSPPASSTRSADSSAARRTRPLA